MLIIVRRKQYYYVFSSQIDSNLYIFPYQGNIESWLQKTNINKIKKTRFYERIAWLKYDKIGK